MSKRKKPSTEFIRREDVLKKEYGLRRENLREVVFSMMRLLPKPDTIVPEKQRERFFTALQAILDLWEEPRP